MKKFLKEFFSCNNGFSIVPVAVTIAIMTATLWVLTIWALNPDEPALLEAFKSLGRFWLIWAGIVLLSIAMFKVAKSVEKE